MRQRHITAVRSRSHAATTEPQTDHTHAEADRDAHTHARDQRRKSRNGNRVRIVAAEKEPVRLPPVVATCILKRAALGAHLVEEE